MAKILCGISGIEFSCDHLPIYLDSREYAHPIFFMPQKKLLGLYQKYRHGELGEIDSYLLFLAYFNSTDLIEWRVPAKYHAGTQSIIANTFDSLVSAVEKINRVKNPSVHFSHISVSPDTSNFTNCAYWIASWESTYESFVSGYASQRLKQELCDIEEKLAYLCKDANRDEVLFAARLATWADKAGTFPRFPIQVGASVMPCNEYWKQIIRKCTNAESIFNIPSKDVQELLEHCEEYIDAGSIYAHHLFKILKEGMKKQQGFLGLGDFTFSIISEDTSAEQANRIAIIQNAPTEAPRRIDYPSQFAYLKAKLAFEMAQNSAAQIVQEEYRKQEAQEETEEIEETEEAQEIEEIEEDLQDLQDLQDLENLEESFEEYSEGESYGL